jgi:hypothetical protein
MIVFFFTYYNSKSEIINYQKNELASFYNGWHNGGSVAAPIKPSCFQYIPSFLDQIPTIDTLLQKPILGKVVLNKESIEITNSDFEMNENGKLNGAYLEFSSDRYKYIFATNQELLRSKKAFILQNGRLFQKGFTATIPLTEIKTGDYFINILSKNGEHWQKIKTNYYLEVEGIEPKKVIQNW